MKSTSLVTLAAILVASSTLAAQGATLRFDPIADASIFQSNVNNGSGGGNGLYVGANTSGFVRRALIAFDVAQAVPQGSTIVDVLLSATLGDFSNNSTLPTVLVNLHRLSKSWGEGTTQQQVPANDVLSMMGQGMAATEGDVTWSSRFHNAMPAQPWITPGGEFEPSPSATASVGTTIGTTVAWSNQTMVSEVQEWLDDPTSNFGWLLSSGSESTASSLRVFFTGDVATADNWPQLEVMFRVPGDFNGDDAVDEGDLGEWEVQFGSLGHSTADADRDDDVDGADFLVWQRSVGSPTTMATSVRQDFSPVPEPATLALASGFFFGWLSLVPAARRTR